MQTRSGRILTNNCLKKKKRKYPVHEKIATVKKQVVHKSSPSTIYFVRKIQRWWRHCRTNIFINHTDFLTLEPFTTRTYHLKDSTSGHIYRFNPESLGNYYLQEGNFINPYTRKTISNDDLRRLDAQIMKFDATFESLSARRKSIEHQKKLEYEHTEMCNYLHFQCCEIINKLDNLSHINDVTSFINAEFHVEYIVLPLFFDTFRELFTYDNNFACDSIHYIFDELTAKIDEVDSKFYKWLLTITQGKISKFISDIKFLLPVLIIS